MATREKSSSPRDAKISTRDECAPRKLPPRFPQSRSGSAAFTRPREPRSAHEVPSHPQHPHPQASDRVARPSRRCASHRRSIRGHGGGVKGRCDRHRSSGPLLRVNRPGSSWEELGAGCGSRQVSNSGLRARVTIKKRCRWVSPAAAKNRNDAVADQASSSGTTTPPRTMSIGRLPAAIRRLSELMPRQR